MTDDLPPPFVATNRIATLASADVDQMVSRGHDLDYQLRICRALMADGVVLPFPFERAVVLLIKERHFAEALEICEYIDQICDTLEREWDGWSAKTWLSPKLVKCRHRVPSLRLKVHG